MTRAEALKLVEELHSLIGNYPSVNPNKLDRCEDIIRKLRQSSDNLYLREKTSAVAEEFGYWFSDRKWTRHGTAEQMRHFVLMSIMKLEGAIDDAFL